MLFNSLQIEKNALASARIFSQEITDGYRRDEIDPKTAASKLQGLGQFGCYKSGELCLEQAAYSEDLNETDYWLERAENTFRSVGDLSKLRPSSPNLPFCAQSQMRLMQFGTLSLMYRDWRLPTAEEAANDYEQSVEFGLSFIHAIETATKSRETSPRTARECYGSLGEFAVLCLTQRKGISEGITDCWWSCPTTFTNDEWGLTDLSEEDLSANRIRTNWDIDIFTQDDAGLITPSYKLQVKNGSKSISDSRPYAPGIITINLSRDLSLPGIDPWVSASIINECVGELSSEDPVASAATERLEARTTKLLDIIYRESN